jgi:hypothetical protein
MGKALSFSNFCIDKVIERWHNISKGSCMAFFVVIFDTPTKAKIRKSRSRLFWKMKPLRSWEGYLHSGEFCEQTGSLACLDHAGSRLLNPIQCK